MRTFPTLDVVAVVTGRMTCDLVSDLARVMNHVLDDELDYHQLPGASHAAAPVIYQQHEWLRDLVLRPTNDGLDEDCAKILDEHGLTLELQSAEELGFGVDWVRGNGLRDWLVIMSNGPQFMDAEERQRRQRERAAKIKGISDALGDAADSIRRVGEAMKGFPELSNEDEPQS